MKKYPSVNDMQKMINTEGIVQISFDGENLHDIIHPYSLPGYEYLSGEFVSFLDRFKGIIPPKMPILLKITGREYNDEEKETIDNAIWMHYGLYLSEASSNLKRLSCRILIY
ncbi:MAG: hypothetical protein KBS83_07500, partial [Lachnospiraceae bacterium]|nr:hypothetical protein [Candidatus Equihabitans merdae]